MDRIKRERTIEVTLLHTDGYALEAEILLGDVTLYVMDEVSPPGEALPSPTVLDVEFTVMVVSDVDWEAAFSGNPEGRRALERQQGWSYIGFGEITAVDPVRVDFGALELEYDGLQTHDARCVGEYVRVPIDRIGIHAAE